MTDKRLIIQKADDRILEEIEKLLREPNPINRLALAQLVIAWKLGVQEDEA